MIGFEDFVYPIWAIILLCIVMIWDVIWKGISIWKSGRNNQLSWFIVLLIFNTAGILPIIYLLLFQKKPKKKDGR